MIFEYTAPKLTKYGKITEFIQAGSAVIATGDVTGDGVSDTLFDTNGDGDGDLVVGGASGGQTPVTRIEREGARANFYDGDGDGEPGIGEIDGNLEAFRGNRGGLAEPARSDGWSNSDRD